MNYVKSCFVTFENSKVTRVRTGPVPGSGPGRSKTGGIGYGGLSNYCPSVLDTVGWVI